MIIKNSLIPILSFFVVILTAVTAYSEYEDEMSRVHVENTQDNDNDEIYNPVLLQLQVEADERKPNMNMDMGAKTEISLKSVRNISNNQLSNEYISIEHDDDHHNIAMDEEIEEDDNNTSTEAIEQNTRALLKEQEEDEAGIQRNNNRMGRHFITTTTTIPQYIRRISEVQQIQTKADTNASTSDYEEDQIIDRMMKKHTNKMPLNKNLDYSSEEDDEIVPLAMKYYDEIPPENASSSRQTEKITSEDYYMDEYNEPESTTITVQSLDDSFLQTVSSGTTTIRTANATPTPTPTVTPLATTLASQTHLTERNNLLILPTSSPLPKPPPSELQTQTMLSTTTTTTRIISAAAAAAAAMAITSTDKKGKQIPIVNTVPVVTTTTTTRRRLLPHEKLRNYIEDAYIRMPLAVIVDPSEDSLEYTKTLWNDALRTDLNIKIILVTLNESEESPAAFNFNNTRQFLAGLNSIKEQNSGDTFRGILDAAELVPYDSAVFISRAQLAKHTDHVQDAAITLLKKRIRLYLIWFGERSLSENETQDSIGGILGEVAIRSGGEILHIVSNETSQELEGSTLTIVADALRGSQEVDVPVDTTLSSLHVKIDKLMRRAVLETPNGEINLNKMVKFKMLTLKTFDDDDNRLDAYVPLTKLRKATVYKLKLIPEDFTTEYSVFVRGERKADTFLDDMIKHFETYLLDHHTSYPVRGRNIKLENIVAADIGDVTVPTHSKIQFPDDENKSLPKTEVETFSTHEIHRNAINNGKSNITYLASAQSQQRNFNFLYKTNTKIEMGTHSQILISPGMLGQLYFEVTNIGYESSYYNIQVVDERRYLVRLNPQSLFLRPGQMSTVTVSVFAPQDTEANTIDHITFTTATSTTTASLTANLKIITNIDAQDNTPPSVYWTFGSRCEGVSREFDQCSERFWNMYITAQDWQTGIMRLQANPASGLIYTKAYTIGTTEPLKATYVASCCDTRVTIAAIDGAGNQYSYAIDVRDLVLTDASIAAIALGVILLTLIIILLIVAITWYCRRRKIVLDLPTYRSHSTRSME